MTLAEIQFFHPHSPNGSNPPAGVAKLNPDSLNNLQHYTARLNISSHSLNNENQRSHRRSHLKILKIVGSSETGWSKWPVSLKFSADTAIQFFLLQSNQSVLILEKKQKTRLLTFQEDLYSVKLLHFH